MCTGIAIAISELPSAFGGDGRVADRLYKRGVRIAKEAFEPIAQRLKRSATLPKRSPTIQPE